MHQNGRIAAVTYKHCNTPKSVDALRRSGLQGWDNDQSIAKNVKLMYQHAKNCKDENSKRPVERVIVSVKATNILSWPEGTTNTEVSDKEDKELDKEISDKLSAEVPADLQHEVKRIIRSLWRIDDLFETKKNPALGSARWKQFRALFLQADTAACRHLVKIIDLARDVVLKSNAGNKQERRRQTNDDKEGNDREFADKIPALLADTANTNNQIWVRAKNAKKASELDTIPEDILNHEFPHLKYTAFHGIKSRLQKRERMYKDSCKNDDELDQRHQTMRNNTQQFRSPDVLPQENKYTISNGGAQQIGSFILASINVMPRKQDDRMSNDEEFADKIPALLADADNTENQIWVRATKAKKGESGEIPEDVLNHESKSGHLYQRSS